MTSILKRHKNLLPVLFLAGVSLYTIIYVRLSTYTIDGVTHSYLISVQNYIGFILVFISIACYFLFRPYYRYIVFIVIFLGCLGLSSYTIFSGSINSIPFQFTSLLAGFFYVILNYERLKKKLGIPTDKEIDPINDPQQIQTFKKKFADKTNEQLEEILVDGRFVNDAKIAAKELLEERI